MRRFSRFLLTVLAIGCCLASNSRGWAQSSAEVEVDPDAPEAQRDRVDIENDAEYDSNGVRIEQGKRRPILDGIGWVVGIPRKVLFWDHRADNHAVSEATVAEVSDYLDHEGLNETVVRVNQYAPIKEWRRLTQNKKVGAGWRYSVGTLHWLKYTLVPGRVFGGDEYNPYTDSLYLYSDMPTLSLASAAYAKDVNLRNHPGLYAAVQDLPGVSLWHETLATREVITYISIHGSSEEIEKVRHDLYTRYGIETAAAVGQVASVGSGLFTVVGAVGGHAVAAGQNYSSNRR